MLPRKRTPTAKRYRSFQPRTCTQGLVPNKVFAVRNAGVEFPRVPGDLGTGRRRPVPRNLCAVHYQLLKNTRVALVVVPTPPGRHSLLQILLENGSPTPNVTAADCNAA